MNLEHLSYVYFYPWVTTVGVAARISAWRDLWQFKIAYYAKKNAENSRTFQTDESGVSHVSSQVHISIFRSNKLQRLNSIRAVRNRSTHLVFTYALLLMDLPLEFLLVTQQKQKKKNPRIVFWW